MNRPEQIIVRHWIEGLDDDEKDAALAKMLDYAIHNGLMNIEDRKESPYWIHGENEALI